MHVSPNTKTKSFDVEQNALCDLVISRFPSVIVLIGVPFLEQLVPQIELNFTY